ncbi:CRISPR-associated endonuclease Cas2 [Roseiconus lacunae]|uniref:CRISPR-associated endonuclease Cas2 n=1 Tax=Roseiconus lacunae TaxID=2605694 RepID=UPI0030879B8E|nr:CRISPR-associated endonuclease Cas2 [Stieleria sp. HD01]
MMVLVTYDVATANAAGKRRLSRVAKTCLNYGQRVQNSVFECLVTPDQWTNLRHELISEIDATEDSLRFYFLGSNYKHRVEHVGSNPTTDLDDPLII